MEKEKEQTNDTEEVVIIPKGELKKIIEAVNKNQRKLIMKIEKKYGVDLSYRSDAELHTVLRKKGVPSLSKLLRMTKSEKLLEG